MRPREGMYYWSTETGTPVTWSQLGMFPSDMGALAEFQRLGAKCYVFGKEDWSHKLRPRTLAVFRNGEVIILARQ